MTAKKKLIAFLSNSIAAQYDPMIHVANPIFFWGGVNYFGANNNFVCVRRSVLWRSAAVNV